MSNQPQLADEQMTTAGPPHTPQPVAWRYSDGVSPRLQEKRNWLHKISTFRSGVKASDENIQQPEQIVRHVLALTMWFLINQTKLCNSDSNRHKTRSTLNTN